MRRPAIFPAAAPGLGVLAGAALLFGGVGLTEVGLSGIGLAALAQTGPGAPATEPTASEAAWTRADRPAAVAVPPETLAAPPQFEDGRDDLWREQTFDDGEAWRQEPLIDPAWRGTEPPSPFKSRTSSDGRLSLGYDYDEYARTMRNARTPDSAYRLPDTLSVLRFEF